MVQGLLENRLSLRFLDELFANAAELQYTRTLLFFSVVDLMGLVVNRIQPPSTPLSRRARPLACRSSRSITNSTTRDRHLGRDGRHHGERLETVVTTMGGALALCNGLSLQVLAGNQVAPALHRFEESSTTCTGLAGSAWPFNPAWCWQRVLLERTAMHKSGRCWTRPGDSR